MNLQHLKAFRSVAKNRLNMSRAAKQLGQSQASISRQVRALEQELGCTLFVRHGRRLSTLTPEGEQVLDISGDILDRLDGISQLGRQQSSPHQGRLNLAASHSQMRYVLPDVISRLAHQYPHLDLCLHQGCGERLQQLAQSMRIDMLVVGDASGLDRELVAMPCWGWHPCLLVPDNHPLTRAAFLRLQDLARYPVIIGDPDCGGGSHIARVLEQAGAHIMAQADDSGSARALVRANLGMAVLPSLACTPPGRGLAALDVRHLLGQGTSFLCWRRQHFISAQMRAFAGLYAPHRADAMDAAQSCRDASARAALFRNLQTPAHPEPASP